MEQNELKEIKQKEPSQHIEEERNVKIEKPINNNLDEKYLQIMNRSLKKKVKT